MDVGDVTEFGGDVGELVAADTVTGEDRGLSELPIALPVASESAFLSNNLPRWTFQK